MMIIISILTTRGGTQLKSVVIFINKCRNFIIIVEWGLKQLSTEIYSQSYTKTNNMPSHVNGKIHYISRASVLAAMAE